MMRRIIFIIAKRALIFFVAVATMLLLLIAAAVIPQDNIRTHMTETAEIMCEDNEIYDVIDFLQSSRIDHYADSVWLSIAFYLDENKPLESVVWSSYYSKPGQYANDELREAVQQNPEPNTEYLRYWHGPAGTLRFLHQFWNINQINNLHVVLMIVLYLVLMYVLIRHSFRAEAFAFSISMIAVSIWFVPLCLEYTYSFLCMLVASIIEVELALNRKYGNLGIFFMLTGMVTVYLDFLTTETLSLLIPLLLILNR